MILLAAGCLCASAQEADTKEVFKSHWYVQAQGGFQHTLGEIKWKDLNSGNAQIAIGYQFSKVWGARIALNGWQSKGAWTTNETKVYKWNYVAPSLDLTVNLSNLISGFNPKRIVDVSLFLGPEANIAWNNKEQNDIVAAYPDIQKLEEYRKDYNWTGTKINPFGHFGLDVDFKVSDRVKINLEGAANILSDKYNSKKREKVSRPDWYFNVLAGVKVALGNPYNTIVPEPVAPIVKPEPKPEPKPVVKKIEEKTINVFFKIRQSIISPAENVKVQEMIAFLKDVPEAKVTVTGYADAGTGNPRINIRLSEGRVNYVANMLRNEYNIDADRIYTEFKGDTEQPFADNDSNRVTVCLTK